jgi:hypothetical protein
MESMMITHLQFCFSLISPTLLFMIVESLLEWQKKILPILFEILLNRSRELFLISEIHPV